MSSAGWSLAGLAAVGAALYVFFKPGQAKAEQTMATNENPQQPLAAQSTITSDPATWPGDDNDPIWAVAHAIAYAEGANVSGSNPDRLNNPGDLSDGAQTYGSEHHSGSNVTHFPSKEIGWQWLHDKIKRIANGQSSSYQVDMSWTEIAQKWAGDWQNWVKNVTDRLGIDPTARFGDWFGV